MACTYTNPLRVVQLNLVDIFMLIAITFFHSICKLNWALTGISDIQSENLYRNLPV